MRRTMSSVTWVSDESSMSMRIKLPAEFACCVRLNAIDSASSGEIFKSHLRKLDADVRLELARGDQVQQLVVYFRGLMRFSFRSDAFAERVNRNGDSLLVYILSHAYGIGNFHARNKTRTELDAKAGGLAETTQRAMVG